MSEQKKEELVIVVNGEPVHIEANLNEELVAVVAQALAKSQNTGQPPENWELKNASGNLIDQHQKVRALGLPPGTKLFLSPKAGVGGRD
jgi:hypothetical protein